MAPELFSGFEPARFPGSTIQALGLAAAAYRCNVRTGERMSLRLRQAVFEEGRDVSADGELRSIAHEFGIEPVDREGAAQRVAADWEKGRARSVRGSPHFFVGGRGWFCPTLRISHSGSDFEIVADSAALADFYAMALR